MNIVDGKCPNCGASIRIDKDTDAGICEYCGYSFLVSAAITNYGTYINKQEVHNVKEDNEWTYKTNQEKSNMVLYIISGVMVIGCLIMAIFLITMFR